MILPTIKISYRQVLPVDPMVIYFIAGRRHHDELRYLVVVRQYFYVKRPLNIRSALKQIYNNI